MRSWQGRLFADIISIKRDIVGIMAQQAFQRSVISMRLMAELGMQCGLTVADLLRGTGLKAQQLLQPDLLVSRQQELKLIDNLATLADGHVALGIRAGKKYHVTAFGALGFAVMSSPNVRSAIDVGLQYFNLTFAFSSFTVTDDQHATQVRLEVDADVPAHLAAFVVERDLAALISVARDLYHLEPMINQVQFQHLAGHELKDYQDFFGVKPAFSASCNLVSFERAKMLQPLPQANELAYQSALAQCQQLLESRKVRCGLADKVHRHLFNTSADMPSMEEVAAGLCMTSRTLRRHLQAEGISFAALRDEVRLSLANELLAASQLSIEQIATRLGYAESTSFINAFKRWRGVTPYVFRHRMAGS